MKTIRENLLRVETIKGQVKELNKEKELTLKDVIKLVIDKTKEIKASDNPTFKLMTKAQTVDYIKVTEETKGSPIFGAVCDYISNNLSLDIDEVSSTQFITINKLYTKSLLKENERWACTGLSKIINKSSIKKCTTKKEYSSLIKEANEFINISK